MVMTIEMRSAEYLRCYSVTGKNNYKFLSQCSSAALHKMKVYTGRSMNLESQEFVTLSYP